MLYTDNGFNVKHTTQGATVCSYTLYQIKLSAGRQEPKVSACLTVSVSVGCSQSNFLENIKTVELMERRNTYYLPIIDTFLLPLVVSGRCSLSELHFQLCAINK